MSGFYRKYPKLFAFFTYYQMLGGLIGLMITFMLLRDLGDDSEYWLRIALQTLAFSLSFYCGYLFLNKDYHKAIDLSIFCHLLQLFELQLMGYFYVFASGLGFFVPLWGQTNDFLVTMSISKFNLALAPQDQPGFGAINLVAVLMLILLGLLKSEAIRRKNKAIQ